MLKRSRSASLPRDLGEGYFLGESDFHSDVYDDTNDELPVPTQSTPTTFSTLCKVVVMILAGSFSSIFYEMILKIDKTSSLLAAFTLHVWIVVTSLPNVMQYLFSPKIPLCYHLLIVLLSFSFLFLKSYAIQLLPMPIIIVCSNMQLVLGLLVGKLLFRKSFCITQYVSVMVIAVGCTFITITSNNSSSDLRTPGDFILGIVSILFAILSIAIMIPVGSMIVQKYDADIEEQIFFQHFLSLPLFILQWEKIQPSLNRLCEFNDPGHLFSIWNISFPKIVFLLLATTILAQVNRYLTMDLSLSLSPLISQLLNTINKTIVLLVSMVYFNSPPYPGIFVWVGVLVQTMGSVAYVQSSLADSSTGNFKPNKKLTRFSRVSWTGKRLGLSEKDLTYLREVANKAEKHREKKNNILEQEPSKVRRRHAYTTLPELKLKKIIN